jgi:hypothetical protein
MSKKINRNQIAFIGFSIVFAWVALMLIINNDFIRQNPILMNLPVFIGYVIISMMTVGKETPLLIRWIVVFILAFCATWLTSIVVFLLFAFFYGLQWA